MDAGCCHCRYFKPTSRHNNSHEQKDTQSRRNLSWAVTLRAHAILEANLKISAGAGKDCGTSAFSMLGIPKIMPKSSDPKAQHPQPNCSNQQNLAKQLGLKTRDRKRLPKSASHELSPTKADSPLTASRQWDSNGISSPWGSATESGP